MAVKTANAENTHTATLVSEELAEMGYNAKRYGFSGAPDKNYGIRISGEKLGNADVTLWFDNFLQAASEKKKWIIEVHDPGVRAIDQKELTGSEKNVLELSKQLETKFKESLGIKEVDVTRHSFASLWRLAVVHGISI